MNVVEITECFISVSNVKVLVGAFNQEKSFRKPSLQAPIDGLHYDPSIGPQCDLFCPSCARRTRCSRAATLGCPRLTTCSSAPGTRTRSVTYHRCMYYSWNKSKTTIIFEGKSPSVITCAGPHIRCDHFPRGGGGSRACGDL